MPSLCVCVCVCSRREFSSHKRTDAVRLQSNDIFLFVLVNHLASACDTLTNASIFIFAQRNHEHFPSICRAYLIRPSACQSIYSDLSGLFECQRKAKMCEMAVPSPWCAHASSIYVMHEEQSANSRCQRAQSTFFSVSQPRRRAKVFDALFCLDIASAGEIFSMTVRYYWLSNTSTSNVSPLRFQDVGIPSDCRNFRFDRENKRATRGICIAHTHTIDIVDFSRRRRSHVILYIQPVCQINRL